MVRLKLQEPGKCLQGATPNRNGAGPVAVHSYSVPVFYLLCSRGSTDTQWIAAWWLDRSLRSSPHVAVQCLIMTTHEWIDSVQLPSSVILGWLWWFLERGATVVIVPMAWKCREKLRPHRLLGPDRVSAVTNEYSTLSFWSACVGSTVTFNS